MRSGEQLLVAAAWTPLILGGVAWSTGLVGLGVGMAAVGLTAALGAVGAASARPDWQVFGDAVVYGRHSRRVALTFDDGPDRVTTPRILDILQSHGVSATFFLLADRVKQAPMLARQIVDCGFGVGLHGATHDVTVAVRHPDRGRRWLMEGRARLEDVCGKPIYWFRPPFGVVSPRTFMALAGTGLQLAWCSQRIGDGVAIDKVLFERRCAKVSPRDIVLLHDPNPVTAAHLSGVLTDWLCQGMEVTDLDAALEEG